MAITGFICHDDYLAKTSRLTDEEVGRLFRALMTYHITGDKPFVEGRESLAFDFICEDIDKAEQAYKAKCETNRRNRMASNGNCGLRLMTNDTDGQRPLTTVVDEKPKKEVKRFTPPSLEQVQEYCRERNNHVDAQRFVDFYESKGWKVGNQPMKSWQACVRTWERDDRKSTKGYAQRDYSGEQQAAMDRMMEGFDDA